MQCTIGERSKLPGIHENCETSRYPNCYYVSMCYSGTPKKSPLELNSQLTAAKLTQMCQNFIPEEKWLEYV